MPSHQGKQLLELYNTSEDCLEALEAFCHDLSFGERKALITLSRSQSIPDQCSSPILYGKVKPILDKLVIEPPFESLAQSLKSEGHLVIRLLSSPLTTGLLIVYALGVELSDEEVLLGKEESFHKELLATQTDRRESTWNWDSFFNLSPLGSTDIVHPLFPRQTSLQHSFAFRLLRFESSIRGRVILPHYSRRGVSSETSGRLLARLPQYRIFKRYRGPLSTFHRSLDPRNVTSLDVVHHYIRTGDWMFGRTELKQRWYPSGLLPRTYFSWGGDAIALSGYLRNFFNDLADCFDPTHRKNRVQPDWLRHPDRKSTNGFLFYDLTSFTSWFHEHEPFLRALARRFKGVIVYLSGFDLTLTSHDLGDLIDAYTDGLNNLPSFVVDNRVFKRIDYCDREFVHQCAGFLGVPGNLVTCTLAHGLAQAALQESPRCLQVPGDDVGCPYVSENHANDIGVCAKTLGVLQFDKVYCTPGISVYLKRLVLDLHSRLDLAPMLIFPLLPYLINPEKSYRSNRFRLPPVKTLRPRCARVLVAFQRDLWNLTRGDLDSESEEIILLFLRRVHDMVGLPWGPIFQGHLYGIDDEEQERYPNITLKFSVDDDDCLRKSPDIEFASKHVTSMVIRLTSEVPKTPPFNSLKCGETIIVKRQKGWTYLEDMGYVKVVGIPGEKVTLIGSDARDAFLFSAEPPLREVEVLSDLTSSQLVAAGVLSSGDSTVFEGDDGSGSRHTDWNTMSWRYRRYVDLDDPKGASLYGRSRRWVEESLSSTRESLSPEPFTTILDY